LLINTIREADGSVVIDLRGELDVSSADRLRQILTDAAGLRPKAIVVDLLGVTFIDSTGVGVLVGGRHTARVNQVAYSVRNPGAFVESLLRKTGLYGPLVAE